MMAIYGFHSENNFWENCHFKQFCFLNYPVFVHSELVNGQCTDQCINQCTGQFGLVFKEWETITSTYPETARRLNLVTKQVDIDIYYDLGGKMEVNNIDDEDGIILKIPRMKKKKPELVDFDNSPVKSGT